MKKDDVYSNLFAEEKIDLEFLKEFVSEICLNVKLSLEMELETRCRRCATVRLMAL